MRTLRRLCLALLAGAVIVGLGAACARAGNGGSTAGGGTGTASPSASQTASAGVAVTVTRAGGFAGVNQTIAVAADGTWVYTDGKKKTTERGTLTEAQRVELARLATEPQLFNELAPTPEPTPCADAFSFVIDVNGRSAGFADCGRHPRPTVDALLAFLADATPF